MTRKITKVLADTAKTVGHAANIGAKAVGIAAVTGAKAVSRAATAGARNVKFKLDELGINSKRRDLFNELGRQVYELSQDGHELPMAAEGLTQQIQELDRNLEKLRVLHAVQKANAAAVRAAEKKARTAPKDVQPAAPCDAAQEEIPDADMPEADAAQAEDVPADAADETPDVPTLNI